MGRSIPKQCARCGNTSYVDVDVTEFVCPKCGASFEILESDRKSADNMLKDISVPKKVKREEKRNYSFLIVIFFLLIIGGSYFLVKNNFFINEKYEEEVREENNSSSLASLYTYFSTKFTGESNGFKYSIIYDYGKSAFVFEADGKEYVLDNVTYLGPQILSCGNEELTLKLETLEVSNHDAINYEGYIYVESTTLEDYAITSIKRIKIYKNTTE